MTNNWSKEHRAPREQPRTSHVARVVSTATDPFQVDEASSWESGRVGQTVRNSVEDPIFFIDIAHRAMSFQGEHWGSMDKREGSAAVEPAQADNIHGLHTPTIPR